MASNTIWEMKKQNISPSEVVDATTLHDFSTAPVVHPVGSPPSSKRKKTDEGTANATARMVPMSIAATTLKNPVVQVPEIPMLVHNGYFENLQHRDVKVTSSDSADNCTFMNGKSRKRKLNICGVQLKYRGRRRKINVFNLFQSLQSKALKEKDPKFKRTDLTPKERVLRQAELRTRITQMWRDLPPTEKDKYREMAKKMQVATMSSKDENVNQRLSLLPRMKSKNGTGDFFKRMRKLEQSAAELALCIGTKVCVVTIADIPGVKKNAPVQSHHYSFAASSDGRGGLNTSVSANDVIMQHLQSQQTKSGQIFNDFKMASGDQPIQMVCTPTECALIQVRRQRQWSEALDHFGQSGKSVGTSNENTNQMQQQLFDMPLASLHLNDQLQRLRQRQANMLQQSALFNPLAVSGMSSNLVPKLHNNAAMENSLLNTQRFDPPANATKAAMEASLLNSQRFETPNTTKDVMESSLLNTQRFETPDEAGHTVNTTAART